MNRKTVKQPINAVEQVTIKDFIRMNLYPAIEMLKNNGHPYFAFTLIAAGIEFLGACMDDKKTKEGFFEPSRSKKRFNDAISKLYSLQKYDYPNNKLYTELRCGMCHVLFPKTTLKLSSGYGKCDENILYIENFYCDFKSACEELLNSSTLWGLENGSNHICWTVSKVPNADPTTVVTKNDKVAVE